MPKRGRRYKEAVGKVDFSKKRDFQKGLEVVLSSSSTNFDETVEIAVRLGVDPRHADQMVRGSVVLPNGLGKEIRVLAFAKGEKEIEAREAGADFVGSDDLVERIKGGWFGFDRAVATPDMMSSVGKIGRILGPRGLMPNAKTGSVTFDLSRAVRELKSGKIDFKVEKAGIIHSAIGKISFGSVKLLENLRSFLQVVLKLKPSSSKGTYLKSIFLTSTMGISIKVDPNSVSDLVN